MNKLLLQCISSQPSSPASHRPASCDSSSSEEAVGNPRNVKYKTELCRTFEEKGRCPYGQKCRFAHGKTELVVFGAESVKKKKCNGFWTNGCCSYGRRCRFGHDEVGWQNTACLLAIEAQCLQPMVKPSRSKLMKILT